ncbi:MAG: hypothetical protein PHN57_00065 [Candidatus Omnitrophica bacterium]|nr:hypothetical protein [Candidatus Omnitrophota bacterium]
MIKKDSLKAKIICFVFFVLILFSLETASRLFFPETLLDKIILVLKQDPLLFWRQKPNINMNFQGCEVATDGLGLRNKARAMAKKPGTIRIICMGASPTFGWGVNYESTYPRQLEKLLNHSRKNHFEVINAGIIGYSSYQGLNFLKNEIVRLDPDIITVSYVLNDIDKYRFFRSNGIPDKQLKPENRFIIDVANFLYQSRFIRILQKFCYYINRPEALYSPGQSRVPPSDYQKNLQDFIDFSSKKGIKIIFVKMPVNLPLPEQVAEPKKLESKIYFDQALAALASNRFDTAINILLKSIRDDPYLNDVYYYLGICYKKKGEPGIARSYFKKAKEKEVFRCAREGQLYNRIMEDVAEKNHVPLVDVVSAFGRNNGEYLFVDPKHDPIHPNAIGHKIIGLAIYDTLTK